MIMKHTIEYQRNYEIDTERYPAVVFESDDWLVCENAPNLEAAQAYNQLLKTYRNSSSSMGTLETSDDLERLFILLESHRGADSLPVVFTAFSTMGNPDFEAIRQNRFEQYVDIDATQDFPAPWNGNGTIEKTLEGIRRGVWEPEYHCMLHHVSPKLWLERLRSDSAAGEFARQAFELSIYGQGEHLPEYEGYSLREQFEFIRTGFNRFEKLFGRKPNAAVTSDAYPETEHLWIVCGVNTVCLKNSRINSGEVVVYDTKPWNMQDLYARQGDINPLSGAVYLTRNAFFEQRMNHQYYGDSADTVMNTVITNLKKRHEPGIISTHRANYVSFLPEVSEIRYEQLDKLLGALSAYGVYFLTSGELGDLYRQGYSTRCVGEKTLLRKWNICPLGLKVHEAFELPSMKKVAINANSQGNFLIT